MLFPWLSEPVQPECRYCGTPAIRTPNGDVCEGCIDKAVEWEERQDAVGELMNGRNEL